MANSHASALSSRPVVCCGCAQQCGIVVDVEDNKIVAIHGDPEHPVSQGFICVKGTDAVELQYHSERIHHPFKRVGARGDGKWVEIGWDQALDEIALQIDSITASHGREALAYSYGTFRGGDWGIGERFMNLYGSPNACGQDKICYGPMTLAETLTYGFGPSVFSWPVAGTTRSIVLWGMRPTAASPLLWRAIRAARRAGAQFIVIDPEFTREAACADIWLQPRPGTDADLALGLLKVTIERDLIDHAFVREHTVGYADLRRHVGDSSLATLAATTGIAAADIERTAVLLASATPTVYNAGNGLCQSGSPAVQTGRAIACLIAITGNLGKAGGHVLAGPPRDMLGNGLMLNAEALPAAQRAKRLGGDRFAFLGPGYDDVDAAVAGAWYGQQHIMSWIATAHEPSLWRAIADEEPYPVKALIVQHHNPLGASANAAATARALTSDKLSLLVVQDLFMTPTSRLADYVLPAAHWLEKPYFSFGIAFLAPAGDYVAANRAAVEPTHEHYSDYDLWRDLGRRLGQADAWPATAEEFFNDCVSPAGLTFDEICAARGPLMGAAARNAERDHLGQPSTTRYGTPSGKVELRSSLLERWGLDGLPVSARPALFAETADYPLILTTGGRSIEAFHENAQQMSHFRKKNPDPYATLHPATAARAGVADGDWMTIATPVGSVRQIARLSDALGEDVIRADRWWYPERAQDRDDPFGFWATNINVCTADDDANTDPVMGSWLLRGLPCRIEKAQA